MRTSLIQIILITLRQKVKLYKRISIVLLILTFFLTNYHICNYFYPLNDPTSVELWWMLKIDIYALIIALCFFLASLRSTDNARMRRIERFIFDVSIGLAMSNVIDRHLFDIRTYTSSDLLMVLIIFMVSYYNFKRLKKHSKQHTNEKR